MKTNGWYYRPKPDITTWELAQALKAFVPHGGANIIGTFPPEVQRHFISYADREKEKEAQNEGI